MMHIEQGIKWDSRFHLSLIKGIIVYLIGLIIIVTASYQPAILTFIIFAIISCCVAVFIRNLSLPSPISRIGSDKAGAVRALVSGFFAYIGCFTLLLFISVQPDLVKVSILGLIAFFTAVLSATKA
jgi:hypothetical protein